jgi:hypothetical protein
MRWLASVGGMTSSIVQRNSDLFGVGALVLVVVAGGAFVMSFLARDAPGVEIAAVVAYAAAVATSIVVAVSGSRGRAGAIMCMALAAPIGLVILGLIVVRVAYSAEGGN